MASGLAFHSHAAGIGQDFCPGSFHREAEAGGGQELKPTFTHQEVKLNPVSLMLGSRQSSSQGGGWGGWAGLAPFSLSSGCSQQLSLSWKFSVDGVNCMEAFQAILVLEGTFSAV